MELKYLENGASDAEEECILVRSAKYLCVSRFPNKIQNGRHAKIHLNQVKSHIIVPTVQTHLMLLQQTGDLVLILIPLIFLQTFFSYIRKLFPAYIEGNIVSVAIYYRLGQLRPYIDWTKWL